MQTTETFEVNIKLINVFPFDNSGEIKNTVMPIYPANKRFYIWYKDSIPLDIDSSIMSDEYELLYQSVKLTEYKSQLKLYVSVYTFCLTIVILLLLSSPFLPEAFAKLYADNSTAIAKDEGISDKGLDELNESKTNSETVEGLSFNNIGFTDLKNNVVYVLLPNGKYSIQESSWNIEDKAVKRIKKINSLGIRYSNGNNVEVMLEKVDLSLKGVWYRTRVGEFATIKDAIETAAQIRGEEKLRNLTNHYVFPVSNLKV